jgi:GTP-binding protein
VRFERDGKVFIAIDTAGVRRKTSVATDVEFYSMHRAERSIRRADVVLLFHDAAEEVSRVDKQLASYVFEHHKPAVFVVNKWDLLRPMPTEKFVRYFRHQFPNLDFVPLAFITAQSGKNVHAVLNLAQNLHKQAGARVGTSELNRVLREALAASAPPSGRTRRPKIFYATQVAEHPPTIVLFTNGPELFDATYQRYLLKTFRDRLPFREVPIKMYLRHKRRGESPPPGAEEAAAKPAPPQREPPTAADVLRLKFQTELSDDELRRDRGRYESELWDDL